MKLLFIIFVCLFTTIASFIPFSTDSQLSALSSITFTLSVNLTWSTCFTTVSTGPVMKLQNITVPVGQCDSGPFIWNTTENKDEIVVTFYSSVIEDAEPPSCLIKNFTYKNPLTPANQPILPSCFVMDSREGYHMTSYWFTALTWEYD